MLLAWEGCKSVCEAVAGSAAPAMQAVEAALATGSDAELLAALEDAEYEVRPNLTDASVFLAQLAEGAPRVSCASCRPARVQLVAAGQPSAQIYGAQLVAHYTVNDACVARPPSSKTALVRPPLTSRPRCVQRERALSVEADTATVQGGCGADASMECGKARVDPSVC